jgi:hypothetical protein
MEICKSKIYARCKGDEENAGRMFQRLAGDSPKMTKIGWNQI